MTRSANYKEPEDVFAFNVLTNAHNHGLFGLNLIFLKLKTL